MRSLSDSLATPHSEFGNISQEQKLGVAKQLLLRELSVAVCRWSAPTTGSKNHCAVWHPARSPCETVFKSKPAQPITNMGLFGPTPPPRVTAQEFKSKVVSQLYVHGFSQKERNEVEELCMGDMYEDKEQDQGIDLGELTRKVEWLKANTGKHILSAEKIAALEQVLKMYM